LNSVKPLVYIAGPFNGLVMGMFVRMGYAGTNDLMMADLVVFTGGPDINPAMYGEQAIPQCGYPNNTRDAQEQAVFEAAKNFGIPMIGICRGAQLLNVLNGGRLYQHVDKHTTQHWIEDCRDGRRYMVTSTHHQMMRPSQAADIIAIASPVGNAIDQEAIGSLCTSKMADGVTINPEADDVDYEVLWYEPTQCLCFQPHPEYSPGKDPHQTLEYFQRLLNEFITFNKKDKVA
jgi:gamma-glutamyl-gamma-aminobutyrate hydrolase PuuD